MRGTLRLGGLSGKRGLMWFGLTLIILGVVFLLENLGIIKGNAGEIVWPAILIIIGLEIILKPLSKKK